MGETHYAVTVGLRSGRVVELPYSLPEANYRSLLREYSTGKARTLTISWPDHGEDRTFDREAIEELAAETVSG